MQGMQQRLFMVVDYLFFIKSWPTILWPREGSSHLTTVKYPLPSLCSRKDAVSTKELRHAELYGVQSIHEIQPQYRDAARKIGLRRARHVALIAYTFEDFEQESSQAECITSRITAVGSGTPAGVPSSLLLGLN